MTDKTKKESKITRKTTFIKTSKYEPAEAIHTNKKYWNEIFNEIDALPPTEEIKSNQLSESLPSELYEKVCNTLGIPMVQQIDDKRKEASDRRHRRMKKEPLMTYRKSIFIDRELDSDTDVETSPRRDDDDIKMENIHQEFLKKSEREQVTWPSRYLQPEREDEKSLVRKADDLTDRIAQDFCAYMKQLGGDQQSQLFTPKAIKELFQIEFDTHVARSLQVVPKELPSVEEKIANVTGELEKSHDAVLEREVTKDIKAEHEPDRVTAFGQSLPRLEQRRAPQNDTKNLWRSARHVPRDLVTLKAVWEGITNLRSVKEYCRWMIEHPEHKRPPYLSSIGMFDPAVLGARLTFEAQHDDGTVSPTIASSEQPLAPIDQLRTRLSELAESS